MGIERGKLRTNDLGALITHVISVAIVFAVMYVYMQGGTPDGILIGAFGVVLGQYYNRATTEDTLTQSERVLRANTEPLPRAAA